MGGFITGIAENIEYVLTPAVIMFFIGSYLTGIFGTPAAFQPVYWILGYVIFVGLNARGVELSFTVTVIVTLLAIAMLLIFFVSAIPLIDFGKYAMNIGADPTTERPSSCLTATGRSCRLAPMASSLPFPLRCGSISPSRKFRLRPRSLLILSVTCRGASCLACSL